MKAISQSTRYPSGVGLDSETELSATVLIHSLLTEKQKRLLSKLMDIKVISLSINPDEMCDGRKTSELCGEITLSYYVSLSQNSKKQQTKILKRT